jgi:hypothetical protein
MAAQAIHTDEWINGSPVPPRNTALLYCISHTADRKTGFKVVILKWVFDIVEYSL